VVPLTDPVRVPSTGATSFTAVTFNLADLFERVATAVPTREAVVCGERRLTFRELDERADRAAGALASAGLGPGDVVALALRNSVEYLELMLGAFKLSAVPVNVNYRYQADELRHVLADSAARILIHEPELAEHVESLGSDLPGLVRSIARGPALDRWLDAAPPAGRRRRSGSDRYVLYTGGTTGSPKGVVWRHEDIFFAAMGGGRRGSDPVTHPDELPHRLSDEPSRVLPASPLMHGTAHWLAFLTLFAGNTVVLASEPTFDPVGLLDLIDREAVSYLVVVGDAFAGPLADAVDAEPGRWDLTSLTVVISGGATLSAATRRNLLDHLPWVIVVDSYGTSETGGQGSRMYSSGMVQPDGPPRFEPREHTVVLDDDLQPVVTGSGIVGRIARRGHIPLGYLGDDEATASTFPVVDGVRWALTGDQATVADDGSLVLLGRGSATINSGGEKIHPEEVESVLREHPAVHDALVVGVPDDRWGERVAAVVAVRPGHQVTSDDLTGHCRGRLAGFKTPRDVALVDQIPRSESGKPDYRWAKGHIGRR
jgi:3-oxocholest-4-en-26-oate---CoA ligase